MKTETIIRILSTNGIEIESELVFFTSGFSAVYRLRANQQEMIVKVYENPDHARSEENGLIALRKFGASTPDVYFCNDGILVISYIKKGSASKKTLIDMLIDVYSKRVEKFGYDTDNSIGSIRQENTYHFDFHLFFREQRLLPLLTRVLASKKINNKLYDDTLHVHQKICDTINLNYSTLIHGDLWGGNVLVGSDSYYLIDPSVSFSHPAQDLAMLAMFGSPLNENDLRTIYKNVIGQDDFLELKLYFQIYPLLVHADLFGGGYALQLQQAVRNYL